MKMDDMVIISVDDHISEPPDLFDRILSGRELATAPKLRSTNEGKDYWEYQGIKLPTVGLNAVVGRVPEEYGIEPTAMSQLRPGNYDVDARIGDMNINGMAASLNFGSCLVMDGRMCHNAKDKDLALVHLRAWNDWHLYEWCNAHPGRFIPCALLPTWDMEATVAEIERLARNGVCAVTINDNPTTLGLPSIHDAYWEPFFKAIADHDMTICLHIGTGNPAPMPTMNTPIEAYITTMPMAISVSAADWLNMAALEKYPTLKIALSEGGIGWIPYFLERADFVHEHHKAWTHSGFRNTRPSEVFRRHFLTCFIDDAFGLLNLKHIGEDLVAYECDYPHSDSVWPNAPEVLWNSIRILSDEQIDKVTHKNAMRFFNFDPFEHHTRETLTVRSLRAQAAAAKVDTTLLSAGGVATPLAPGEALRPVTTGDMARMLASVAMPG